MPKLNPETVTLLDGDIRVFKRPRSRAWQATFKMDGTWVRVSTKCKQLKEAKEAARELYLEYRIRLKHGLPVISKCFADVAAYCILDMQKQLDAGLGKKSYRDYVIVLNRYLIPYFGDKFVPVQFSCFGKIPFKRKSIPQSTAAIVISGNEKSWYIKRLIIFLTIYSYLQFCHR